MAMSVGPSSGGEPGAIASINTTPLVDVMLVLLIIFLITIPVINKTVKVNLPKAVNIPTQTKPENITIAIDREGNIYYNENRMANRAVLLGYNVLVSRNKTAMEQVRNFSADLHSVLISGTRVHDKAA